MKALFILSLFALIPAGARASTTDTDIGTATSTVTSTSTSVNVSTSTTSAIVNACDLPTALQNAVLFEFGNEKKCDEITPNMMAQLKHLLITGLCETEEKDFAMFPALEILKINVSRTLSLPADLLAPLPKLRELHLSNFSRVTSIPDGFLSHTPGLLDVTVDGFPALHSLPAGLFHGQRELQYIAIEAVPLDSFSPSLFSGLAALTRLDLTPSQKQVLLPEGSLADLKSLTTAYLQHLELPAGSFLGLSALSDLNVFSSKIVPGTFAGLDSLHSLSLIPDRPLQAADLRGLHGLQKLSITFAKLGDLPENFFAETPALKDLQFYGAEVTSFAGGRAFNGLGSLERLSMEKNDSPGERLLVDGVFANLPKLRALELPNNGFISLPVGLTRGLHQLRELEITGSKITSLTGNIFPDLDSIQSLVLSDNQISRIEGVVFANIKPAIWIYLGGNPLSQEEMDALYYQHGPKIFFSESYVPGRADLGKMDKEGYLRNADGSLIFMNYFYALKACPAGTRLPTFRELATEALAYGAKIIELKDVKPGEEPAFHGYTYVAARGPDGNEDSFYFGTEGYSRPDGVFGHSWFWSSSESLSSPAETFGFGGSSVAVEISAEKGAMGSVRCTLSAN